MGYRLVHELVAKNDRLLSIALGDALPDVAEQLLALLALEEPRVAVAVVDIVARLRAWAVVHVENEIEPGIATPADYLVYALETVLIVGEPHVVFIGEQLVVEWKTDGVCSRLCNEVDVGLSDVVVFELLPETCCLVWPHSLFQHQVNHPG